MAANTKRWYARSYNEIPILFGSRESKEYYPARMNDKSIAGMSFQSDHFLEPGTKIRIKLLNDAPDMTYSPEAYKVYNAEVKWCRKVDAIDEFDSYGIGVRFNDPSPILNQ